MMEERYHATTQNRFYPDMSNVNKNITVEAKRISPPTTFLTLTVPNPFFCSFLQAHAGGSTSMSTCPFPFTPFQVYSSFILSHFRDKGSR